MSTVTSLPAETLDQIAAALERSTDLQNFAVTPHLRSVVSPRHTQFRIVRAPLLSPIWARFVENRSLAENVRTLEVQAAEIEWNREDVDAPITPVVFKSSDEQQSAQEQKGECPDDGSDDESDTAIKSRFTAKNLTDLAAERIFVSALKNMTGLTSFQWSRTPPLIDPKVEDDVWTILLKRCPDVREIKVLDGEKPHEFSWYDDMDDDPAYQRPSRNPIFFTFTNLTSFIMKTHAWNVGSRGMPDIESFAKMLVKGSPDLEVLQLEFVLYQNSEHKTADITPLLSDAHWKSLRRLCLYKVHAPSAAVSSFLTSHPTIEDLSVSSLICPTPFSLPPGVLPSLKSLNASPEYVTAVLESSTQTPRPLELISGVLLDDSFLALLEQSGSGATLKRLNARTCVDPSLVVKLAKLAPRIEWLSLDYSGSPNHAPGLDWYSAISHLPDLITFEGVQLLKSDKSSSENSDTIRALVKACPKLRRVPWYMSDVGVWLKSVVVIEHNGPTVTWSLRADLGDTEGAIDNSWGENGKGTFELS